MADTDTKLGPVLTPEEWRFLLDDGHPLLPFTVGDIDSLNPHDAARALAVANNRLPDDDPRKITWEMVDALRASAWGADTEAQQSAVERLADILAGYLPPREET